MSRKPWSFEEESLLLELKYQNYPLEEIAKYFDRSVDSIRNKLWYLAEEYRNTPWKFYKKIEEHEGKEKEYMPKKLTPTQEDLVKKLEEAVEIAKKLELNLTLRVVIKVIEVALLILKTF